VSEFRLTFVCTGNRFRSALGEALVREAVDGLPVRVDSLGTLDLGAVPPLPEAVEHGTRLGVDISGHRARTLVGERLEHADLVLGFERMHVVTAVVDAGAPRKRTFTLPELVGLLERARPRPDGEPVERARQAVSAAAALRPPDPRLVGLPELADPLGRAPDAVRGIADDVAALTSRLVRLLFGR
jgi:protein-tyrosine phosphatase